MEPLFHIQPPLATTTLAHLNEDFAISVQLVFLDGRVPERIVRVELWSNLPRGYEWSSWELAEVDDVEVSGIPQGAVVKSYRGAVPPSKIGFHEFTIRAFYVEHGREDIWWAGSFQKNGKVFVTDAERKASLKSTDVLLGIDPAWFISDDVSERPVTTPSPPPSEGSPSPTDSKFSSAHGADIVVLSGHLQFPVETAYWARIFPVGLVNCLGLIRRNVWWLEPNTYLGSDKPTVFFLFERSDRMFVLLIPLTMNGVSAAILPQKDASVGVQITLEHNNDGQARIFVMVGSGQPHMLVERAMVQIRRLLRKSSLGTVPMPVANVVRQSVDRLAPMWYDRLGMCTWNMFYKNPTHEGISRALDTMVHQLKMPVGFLILDDGWQRTTQLERLTSLEPDQAKFERGLAPFIRDVKQTFNLEHVGIWFPLQGYWNGIEPDSDLGRKYQLRQIASRGNVWLIEATDVKTFYNDIKTYLEGEGVDFFKIDNQASFDLYVGEVTYDSAPLWKHYQDAMQETFGSNLVLSMAQSPNIIFNTSLVEPPSFPAITQPFAVARNSDDFYPERLDMNAGHVYTNAINNIWTSTFSVGIPDWDMFQSEGPYGAFHAASRALNNGPIYLADEPNTHDPSAVRPLFVGGVAGSEHRILRPQFPALPSIDSIFCDARDVRQALKICNLTPVEGNIASWREGTCFVGGLFNCTTFSLCDMIGPLELIESVGWRTMSPNGDGPMSYQLGVMDESDGPFAAYVFNRRAVRRLERNASLSIFLSPACFEVVTFAPIVSLDMPRAESTLAPVAEEAEEAVSTAPSVVEGTISAAEEPAEATTVEPAAASPSNTTRQIELACMGLADKYNGSVALSAIDLIHGDGGVANPVGYRATLWARGRTAFYIGGLEAPMTAHLRVLIDGEDVPSHLLHCETNLLLVDARLDGNEVVKSVMIDVMTKN